MVKSYDRGHEIYLYNGFWYYMDNNKVLDSKRPCKKCGKSPTKEGFDACLGYVKGASSVCCGHGVHEPILIKPKCSKCKDTGAIVIARGKHYKSVLVCDCQEAIHA